MVVEEIRKMLALSSELNELLGELESHLGTFRELLKGYVMCIHSDVTVVCHKTGRCIIIVIDPAEKKAVEALDIGPEGVKLWSIEDGEFRPASESNVKDFANRHLSTINKCAPAIEEEVMRLEGAVNTLKTIHAAVAMIRT
jgi:hypothetical protein